MVPHFFRKFPKQWVFDKNEKCTMYGRRVCMLTFVPSECKPLSEPPGRPKHPESDFHPFWNGNNCKIIIPTENTLNQYLYFQLLPLSCIYFGPCTGAGTSKLIQDILEILSEIYTCWNIVIQIIKPKKNISFLKTQKIESRLLWVNQATLTSENQSFFSEKKTKALIFENKSFILFNP